MISAKTTLLLPRLLASLWLYPLTSGCVADDAELRQKGLVQAGALGPEQQLTQGSVQLTHLDKKKGEKNQICLPQLNPELWGVEGKESRMGLRGWGVARAAGSCRKDVPALRSPPQLPEQDLARAGEEMQTLHLQVQNSNFILQVQNLNLRSKTFLFCWRGWISVLPGGPLLLHHTCEMQHPCRTIAAAELCNVYAGAPVRHGALGQQAVSL